jgi:hypothetical protein
MADGWSPEFEPRVAGGFRLQLGETDDEMDDGG